MLFSTKCLVAEADRLVACAEGRVALAADGAVAQRAASELKRLHLYRAILTSTNAAHALMPEYIVARGLVNPNVQ